MVVMVMLPSTDSFHLDKPCQVKMIIVMTVLWRNFRRRDTRLLKTCSESVETRAVNVEIWRPGQGNVQNWLLRLNRHSTGFQQVFNPARTGFSGLFRMHACSFNILHSLYCYPL